MITFKGPIYCRLLGKNHRLLLSFGVNVLNIDLAQSDYIKRLLLYVDDHEMEWVITRSSLSALANSLTSTRFDLASLSELLDTGMIQNGMSLVYE